MTQSQGPAKPQEGDDSAQVDQPGPFASAAHWMRRVDQKGDEWIGRLWARYQRFRLDQSAKSKAYLTHCGKTMSPLRAGVKFSVGIVFELLTILLGLAFIWLNAIFFFVKAERVDLSIFKPNAALWFSETFDGQSADLTSLRVERKRGSNRLSIIADDVSVSDDDGAQILAVPFLSAEFDLEALAFGQVVMKRAVIDGGAVTVLRREDGSVTAGLGRPDSVGRFGPIIGQTRTDESSDESPDMLERRGDDDTRFERWREIEQITVRGGEANIVDRLDGLNWALTNLNMTYSADDDIINIQSSAAIKSGETLTPFRFEFQSDSAFSSVNMDVSLIGAQPESLAPQRGRFAALSRLRAPVTLGGTIKASGAQIEDIALSVDIGQGTLVSEDGQESSAFSRAILRTEYDVEAQALTLTQIDLQSEKLTFNGRGVLSDIGSLETGFGKQDLGVNLTLSGITLDGGERFSDIFKIKTATYQGRVNWPDKRFEFSRFDFDFDTYAARFYGEFALRNNKIPIEKLLLNGRVSGDITHETLLRHWPNDFALGGRDFIAERVQRARLDNIILRTDITPESFVAEPRAESGIVLANEALTLTFDMRGADAQIIPTMGTLRSATGRGELLGNRFGLFVESAQIGNAIELSQVILQLPTLSPKGNPLYADFNAAGDVSDLLTYISDPPVSLSANSGITPSEFTGTADLKVSIERPLLREVPEGSLRFSVKGTASNAAAPYGIGPHRMNNGTIVIDVDEKGMDLSGPISIGPWGTVVSVISRFDRGATPLQFGIKGTLTADDLDRFGFGLRRYFGGEVDVKLAAQVDRQSMSAMTLSADLERANLFFQDIWEKPIGAPGTLTAKIARPEGGGYAVSDVAINAGGLSVEGDILLAQDLKLKSVFLPVLNIEGLISGAMAVRERGQQRLLMAINGAYLNLSPWTAQALSPQSGGLNLPVNVSAEIEQLILRDNFTLSGALLDYENDGDGIRQGTLSGAYEGKPFTAQIARLEESQGEGRSIVIEIPDAGVAMKNFYGLNNIQGGALSITGTLPPPGMPGGVIGRAQISRFKVVEAPVFARLLSLASLQGLGEILSGDGMNFDSFDSAFEFENGLLSFEDANASGSAVGLTGTGFIDFREKNAQIDGVLVPAYAVNSLLGGVPLLGDIVVGRKGEGIFALSYSVMGPFEKTQIAVNPLSALTPGFLRQIFQPRRQAPLEGDTPNPGPEDAETDETPEP